MTVVRDQSEAPNIFMLPPCVGPSLNTLNHFAVVDSIRTLRHQACANPLLLQRHTGTASVLGRHSAVGGTV